MHLRRSPLCFGWPSTRLTRLSGVQASLKQFQTFETSLGPSESQIFVGPSWLPQTFSWVLPVSKVHLWVCADSSPCLIYLRRKLLLAFSPDHRLGHPQHVASMLEVSR